MSKLTIISRRSGEWAANAIAEGALRAPSASRHRGMMNWWSKMGFLDQESFKGMLTSAPKGYHWIASFSDAEATVLYKLHPELFDDTTGESMKRFLQSQEGRRWAVPGNKVVKLTHSANIQVK